MPLAASIYGANLFLAGVIRYIHWAYATNGSRLVAPGLDCEFVRHIKRVFIAVPVLYLVAAGLSWINTIIAIAAFVLIPVLYVKPARHTRHLTSLRPVESSTQKIN